MLNKFQTVSTNPYVVNLPRRTFIKQPIEKDKHNKVAERIQNAQKKLMAANVSSQKSQKNYFIEAGQTTFLKKNDG